MDPGPGVEDMKQYKFGGDFLRPECKRFVHAYPTFVSPSARERASDAIEDHVGPRVVQDEMVPEKPVLDIVR
jgi:hypothetical protein